MLCLFRIREIGVHEAHAAEIYPCISTSISLHRCNGITITVYERLEQLSCYLLRIP